MEKKIDALKKTIYNLENDVYPYYWEHFNTCNCGILATTLMNGENFILPVKGMGFAGSAKAAIDICSQTGQPMPAVVAALTKAGFTMEEMKDLEMLENPAILNRSGMKWVFGFYRNKENVIRYLKAWVEILEEEKLNSEQEAQVSDTTEAEQGNVLPKPKEVHHYYRIPNDVMEELKEMSVPEILDSN